MSAVGRSTKLCEGEEEEEEEEEENDTEEITLHNTQILFLDQNHETEFNQFCAQYTQTGLASP